MNASGGGPLAEDVREIGEVVRDQYALVALSECEEDRIVELLQIRTKPVARTS